VTSRHGGAPRGDGSAQRGTHDALPDPRNEDVLVYVNGEIVPRHEAKVSVFDSAFLVGDGVWEGIRLHRGVLVFLDAHLDRLLQAARTTRIELGLSREELTALLYRVLDANGMTEGVHVRVMVSRGTKRTPSQDPRLTAGRPTLVIVPEYKLPDPATAGSGIALFTSSVRRGPPDVLDPRLNCHSKLHEVLALLQALEAGADEALMLDVRGFVSTCNATNFFIVRGEQVWTSTGAYCLQGITRANVLRLCRERGVEAHEKDFSLTDVYDADESFVTGTFGGLTPVRSIDGRTIGSGNVPGPITRALREWYAIELERAGGRGGQG